MLQCEGLPSELSTSRDVLRSSLSVRAFAAQVVTCQPSELVKSGLVFARKIFKAARKAVRASTPPASPLSDAAGEEFLV